REGYRLRRSEERVSAPRAPEDLAGVVRAQGREDLSEEGAHVVVPRVDEEDELAGHGQTRRVGGPDDEREITRFAVAGGRGGERSRRPWIADLVAEGEALADATLVDERTSA